MIGVFDQPNLETGLVKKNTPCLSTCTFKAQLVDLKNYFKHIYYMMLCMGVI